MTDHHPSKTSAPSCGCEHGHQESPLPQGILVTTSGILTGAGLILGWMEIGPGWLQTAAVAGA
jgi:Cd2+/Zn2+-exporting ATPase